VILVTGDAYVDHPSFGMAIVGRVLEAQGFRVGIIAQPDWHSSATSRARRAETVLRHHGGNMDSMVNRYTADRRMRSDDAYTPRRRGRAARPLASSSMRSAYARRTRTTPIVVGGIEASLRRIAHFDYWSEKVRRSVLLDAKADLLVYGNGERQICEIAHRWRRVSDRDITDLRGTAFVRADAPRLDRDRLDHVDTPDRSPAGRSVRGDRHRASRARRAAEHRRSPIGRAFVRRCRSAIARGASMRMPSSSGVGRPGAVRARLAHPAHGVEPGQRARARAAARRCRCVAQPAAHPLTTREMDGVYELPYRRVPHPFYGRRRSLPTR
jgi:uncharacterized radical SAM protein YgiQ